MDVTVNHQIDPTGGIIENVEDRSIIPNSVRDGIGPAVSAEKSVVQRNDDELFSELTTGEHSMQTSSLRLATKAGAIEEMTRPNHVDGDQCDAPVQKAEPRPVGGREGTKPPLEPLLLGALSSISIVVAGQEREPGALLKPISQQTRAPRKLGLEAHLGQISGTENMVRIFRGREERRKLFRDLREVLSSVAEEVIRRPRETLAPKRSPALAGWRSGHVHVGEVGKTDHDDSVPEPLARGCRYVRPRKTPTSIAPNVPRPSTVSPASSRRTAREWKRTRDVTDSTCDPARRMKGQSLAHAKR